MTEDSNPDPDPDPNPATDPDPVMDPNPDTTADAATDGGHAAEELPEGEHEHEFPAQSTIKRWFVTTNHKDIGILYLVTSLFFFLLGGTLALLMRMQLWTPGTGVLSATAYNQAVSTHGLIMVFWFISPFAFGFANYLVPLQIGAKDLAFPRLNALSYWMYLASGILLGVSYFQGSTFPGGWTMYAPLNIPTYTPSIGASAAILALLLFVVSVTISSVNFITTFHRMRAQDLELRNLPPFSATILLTVWMMLFAFAALLAALMILSADRFLGTTYFATETPGGSLLWTHLFWFFGHPEVYIVFFPALGVMAECFQTFTGRRLVGRKWFVLAALLVALQSFIVWMHHMFLTAINLEIKTLFMATTIGISLPFDLMVFSLIYTMIKGRIRFKTPFLFSFGALLLFIIGGVTGVFLGAVVLDYEFRGTYWVVAHFHYVMVGGATALFAAIYYWFPKMTGKMYDELLGKVHFALYFVGFNLLYFPMFIAWETPRRVFEYDPALVPWHKMATVGAFVLGASFLVMFYNFYRSIVAGPDADDNPWEYASTAEWAVSSPPPLENFPGIPSYRGGSLSFLDESTATDGGGASDGDAAANAATAADGGTAIDGGTSTDGGPATDGGVGHADAAEHGGHGQGGAGHADHASIWPFVIGAGSLFLLIGLSGATGASFPEGTRGMIYLLFVLAGVAVTGGGLLNLGREQFHAPELAIGERWPFEGIEKEKLGVWVFLGSDIVLFGAFIGAYIFVRVAYGWQAWHHDLVPEAHAVLPGLINTYILLTSSFAVVLALVAAEKGSRGGLVASLVATLVMGFGFLANKAVEWQHLFHIHTEAFAHGWDLSTNMASTTFYLTTGLHGAHVIGGLIIALYLIVRAWRDHAYLDDNRPVEYFGLYWHFVDIVWLFLFPLFYIL